MFKQRVFVDKDQWECRGRCEPTYPGDVIVYCLYCHHDDIVQTSCLHVIRDYEGTFAKRCRRVDLNSQGYCRAHKDEWKADQRFRSINYKILQGWGSLFDAFQSEIFDEVYAGFVSRFERSIALPANALLDVLEHHTKHSEQVYFVKAGNVVKIGRSLNPQARLKALQKDKGQTIIPDVADMDQAEIVWTFPGGRKAESVLHNKFKKYRVAGEWFRWSREIQKFVKDGREAKHMSVYDFAIGVQEKKAELERRGVAS